VDVGDAQRDRLFGLRVGDLPVAQRAAVAGALVGGQRLLAFGDIVQCSQRGGADIGQVALAKSCLGSERDDEP
jgi:hypothetical protein